MDSALKDWARCVSQDHDLTYPHISAPFGGLNGRIVSLQPVLMSERLLYLDRAIAGLPDDLRAVILVRYRYHWHFVTNEQQARELEYSVATLKRKVDEAHLLLSRIISAKLFRHYPDLEKT